MRDLYAASGAIGSLRPSSVMRPAVDLSEPSVASQTVASASASSVGPNTNSEFAFEIRSGADLKLAACPGSEEQVFVEPVDHRWPQRCRTVQDVEVPVCDADALEGMLRKTVTYSALETLTLCVVASVVVR